MDLLKLLQDLVANVAALQTQLADAEAGLAQAKQLSYEEGFAAGVASVGADKIYSQAEFDAAVMEMKAEMMAQIEGLTQELAVAKGEIEALRAGVEAQVADAVAKIKAEIMPLVEALVAKDAEEDAARGELLAKLQA